MSTIVDKLPILEDEAKERMITGVNQYSPKEKIPYPSENGQSRDQAANIVNVNGRYKSV
jgi:methylmalonyl-CoA mutase N-terminal domain/subunit